MSEREQTSVWTWVIVGCAGSLLVGGILVVGFAFLGYSWIRDVEQSMEDPVLRAERVNQILKCSRLPDGYHPVMGISIPFLLEFALLSDEEQKDPENPSFRERGFLYVDVRAFERDRNKVRNFLEGRSRELDMDNVQGLSVRSREVIGRGTLQIDDGTLLYAAYRGGLRFEQAAPEGISSILLFQCPPQERLKMGIWFGADPDPDTPVEELDLTGTPAEEAAILDFLRHFGICRADRGLPPEK